MLTLGLLLATSDLRSAARSSQVAPQPTATPQERLQQLEGKVADLEKSGGSNEPALATALNELAIFHFQQGDFAAAEPVFRRALTIREAALGPEHPQTAQVLNNLALVLQERGNYPAAQPLLERALALNEKARGPDHPEVATALNNLAALHRLTGNYARAEPLYLRALAINEKINGPDHPSVAIVLNNLGLMYQQQGDTRQGAPADGALARDPRKKRRTGSSGRRARAEQSWEFLLRTRETSTRRSRLYRRAVQIYEKAYGRSHQLFGQTLNNLAIVHLNKKEYAVAGPMYDEALAVRSAALGPTHPDMTIALTSQAIFLRRDRTDCGCGQTANGIGECHGAESRS